MSYESTSAAIKAKKKERAEQGRKVRAEAVEDKDNMNKAEYWLRKCGQGAGR